MRMVILGNGFAGVSALETILEHNRGVHVTLISAEDLGFYSPASLFAYLEGRVSRPSLFLRDKDAYREAGVQAIFGKKAVRLDATQKRVHLEDGIQVPYDRLLIATGAGTARLGVPGEDHPAAAGWSSLGPAASG